LRRDRARDGGGRGGALAAPPRSPPPLRIDKKAAQLASAGPAPHGAATVVMAPARHATKAMALGPRFNVAAMPGSSRPGSTRAPGP
jgi:acyl-CoA reductase-like NAD-dependent aldehyde dehydrogenase